MGVPRPGDVDALFNPPASDPGQPTGDGPTATGAAPTPLAKLKREVKAALWP